MKVLDRTRPFGTISGDSEGRFYEQDNAYFGADGQPWLDRGVVAGVAVEADADAEAAPKPARKGSKATRGESAPEAVDAELNAQLGAA